MLHALPAVIEAAHMHCPGQVQGLSGGFHRHENITRTTDSTVNHFLLRLFRHPRNPHDRSDPASTLRPDPSAALEAEVDDAIATCGGDARVTVRVLLVANSYLETEIERLQQAVSAGYSRRKMASRQKAKNRDNKVD
jgi:hypothetical protein